jgi:hypothetical protein
MGGECNTHGREKKKVWENLEGRDYENLVTDGRIILKWILKKQGVDCTY